MTDTNTTSFTEVVNEDALWADAELVTTLLSASGPVHMLTVLSIATAICIKAGGADPVAVMDNFHKAVSVTLDALPNED
jgi:hypothetical protein